MFGTVFELPRDKARVLPSWETYYRKERSYQKEQEREHALFDEADRIAQQIIDKAELKNLKFRMNEESVRKVESGEFIKNNGGYFLYFASDGGKDAYILCADIREGKTGRRRASGNLYHLTDKKLETFDFIGCTWESPKLMKKVFDIMCNDAPDKDYLWAKNNYLDTYPLNDDYISQLDDIEKHSELISLYGEVQKIARFSFLEKSDGDTLVVLTPADPLRNGSAVWWTESQGGLYCLGSLLPDDGKHPGNPKSGIRMLCPVWTTPDKGEILERIRWMWDHYSGNCSAYQFPLSGDAYAELNDPGEEDFTVHYREGHETLTDAEAAELGNLKKAFCGSEDAEETADTEKEEQNDGQDA